MAQQDQKPGIGFVVSVIVVVALIVGIMAGIMMVRFRSTTVTTAVGTPIHRIYYLLDIGSLREIADELKNEPELVMGFRFNGACLLGNAARKGRVDVIELLLDLGANIDGKYEPHYPSPEYSPLFCAVSKKQYKTVDLLLSRGADAAYGGLHEVTAEQIAEGDDKMLELFRLRK